MALYFQSFLCLVINALFISSSALGLQHHRNYFNEKHHDHHQDDPFVVVADGGSTSSTMKDSERALMLDEKYYDKNDTKQDIVHDISTYEVPRRSTNTRQDSSTSVDWKTDSFRLKASHFYYQENGKEPQYFANDSNFIIVPSQLELTGDFWSDSFDVFWPGSDGFDNRLFMFLNGLPMEDTWEVFSVSVYGDNEELIDFISDTNGPPIGISGTLGTCFKSDNKVIANANGDVIVFENLRLAAFLETDPWNDEEYNDCFASETSNSSKNMDSGLQTSWKFLAVSLFLLLV